MASHEIPKLCEQEAPRLVELSCRWRGRDPEVAGRWLAVAARRLVGRDEDLYVLELVRQDWLGVLDARPGDCDAMASLEVVRAALRHVR